MSKMSKFMTLFGMFLVAVTTAGVNTASWTIVHNEEVPEELK
jgi:cyclic lactone autoinducer peptide